MIARIVRIFELPGAADMLRQVLEAINAPREQIDPLHAPEVVRLMATQMPFVVVIETADGTWEVRKGKDEDQTFRCVGELYVLACRAGIRDFHVQSTLEAETKTRLDAFLDALQHRVTARLQ